MNSQQTLRVILDAFGTLRIPIQIPNQSPEDHKQQLKQHTEGAAYDNARITLTAFFDEYEKFVSEQRTDTDAPESIRLRIAEREERSNDVEFTRLPRLHMPWHVQRSASPRYRKRIYQECVDAMDVSSHSSSSEDDDMSQVELTEHIPKKWRQ